MVAGKVITIEISSEKFTPEKIESILETIRGFGISPQIADKEINDEPTQQISIEEKEKEIFSLIDNIEWFAADKKEEIKEKLRNFLAKNPEFIKSRLELEENQYPLTVTVVEQLNYEAFLILLGELEKDKELLEKEIFSLDERGWNIYNWLVNGLIQKSMVNQLADEKDLSLLRKIDEIVEKYNHFYKKDSSEKPSDMLKEARDIEASEYYQEIESILEKIS